MSNGERPSYQARDQIQRKESRRPKLTEEQRKEAALGTDIDPIISLNKLSVTLPASVGYSDKRPGRKRSVRVHQNGRVVTAIKITPTSTKPPIRHRVIKLFGSKRTIGGGTSREVIRRTRQKAKRQRNRTGRS